MASRLRRLQYIPQSQIYMLPILAVKSVKRLPTSSSRLSSGEVSTVKALQLRPEVPISGVTEPFDPSVMNGPIPFSVWAGQMECLEFELAPDHCFPIVNELYHPDIKVLSQVLYGMMPMAVSEARSYM